MRALDACRKWVLAGLATFAPLGAAHADVTLLYAFKSQSDGCSPDARLFEDKSGNLFGTTENGSSGGDFCKSPGTVFKLAPDGSETILHVFTGENGDGFVPHGVIADKAGNLYGTTQAGGTYGYGTVFKLAPDGTETVLHAFAGGSDGGKPMAGLIQDKSGNLYGTTEGADGSAGTVFKLAPDGTETVLHVFTGYETGDGAYPAGDLILDEQGNLYGTTAEGGTPKCVGYQNEPTGCGTVFKIAPNGTETLLYAFRGSHGDGAGPDRGLIRDKAGNLYGTTAAGGTGCHQSRGCGTVFKLAPNGTETVLYAFTGRSDGVQPQGDLIRDKAGNFYGMTKFGGGAGGHAECEFSIRGCGIVFKIAPDGSEMVVYAFKQHARDGLMPETGLLKGADGEIYGTASIGGVQDCNGGAGCGTVFRLTK